MTEAMPTDSVGIVTPARATFDSPLRLKCGRELPAYELVYETYGTLNTNRTNAVLICHALSGSHHAAGFHHESDAKPGWWDVCIGPGKPIDTNRFHVVSVNNLGGCHGSTGPRSQDPKTGKLYGPTFPSVTVADWVAAQSRLADYLGIERFAAVVGGSLGGMQAMQWAIDFPDRVAHALLIACASRLSAQNIAFNEIARHAITSDLRFHGGHYLEANDNPEQGLMLARMVGHVTYQSDDGLRDKFGRRIQTSEVHDQDTMFQIESYLHHQGRSFSRTFDANTYLLMTRALDEFDPARDFNDDLVAALSKATADFWVCSFTTDWRFSPTRSKEIVDALVTARKNVVSTIIDTPHGHDAFLLPVPRYLDVFHGYMQRVAAAIEPGAASR
ncbi:MAG: homoserine O-acetyltransferase [Gammaproteobacteria bacterium]|nr:homoserine O-acetyltransferase [Gammaproteobacteria bacterium]